MKQDDIIANYQKDEEMMILLFAQWCINHDLDPILVYKEAYPEQKGNEALLKALNDTLSKEDAAHIPTNTLIAMLEMFNNEQLAFIISEKMTKG